jgi:ATP adenylyltransferase
MERMWSPWRSAYITSADERNAQGCFLCDCAQASTSSEENLLVGTSEHCIVVMNRYPYNAGHLLIAPKRHCGDLTELHADEATDLMTTVQKCVRIMNDVLKPHGANLGANLGRHAGAGVPDHLHVHIVPRWSGDTNFMPILADVKVVSEDLHRIWRDLRTAFEQG